LFLHYCQTLARWQSLLLSAAEIHGMMLGYLSTNPEPCFKTWTLLVDDLLSWNELEVATQDQLSKLFLSANMELVQHILDLTMALPSDQESLLSRLTAMSDWCRGYLYGVGLSTPSKFLFENSHVCELLNDITQFSQVELEVDPVEESQLALNQIIHHIQMSVQIIYAQCKQNNSDN
jgi:uncharacterized protein YgfB (UPF0149 family)